MFNQYIFFNIVLTVNQSLPCTVTVAVVDATALAVACAVAWDRALDAEVASPPPQTDETAVATADALLDAASL